MKVLEIIVKENSVKSHRESQNRDKDKDTIMSAKRKDKKKEKSKQDKKLVFLCC
jgi:hypothetical protein